MGGDEGSSRRLVGGSRGLWVWALGLGLLFLLTWTGRWRPGTDSAEFLVLGERFGAFGDLRTVSGYAEGVMPGYPVVLSWLGGLAERWGGTVPGWAIGLNTLGWLAWVGLVFAWAARAWGRRTGLVVAGLCGLSARAMEASADVLPGMLFATLVAGLLWWDGRTRGAASAGGRCLRWAGLGLLLAGLVGLRSVGGLVALGFGLGWVWEAWRRGKMRWGWGGFAVGLGLVGVGGLMVGSLEGLRSDVGALRFAWGAMGWGGVLGVSWEAVSAGIPEAVLGVDASPFVGVLVSGLVLCGGGWLVRLRAAWGGVFFAVALPWFLFESSPRYVVAVLPLAYAGWWGLVLEVERRLPGVQGKRLAGLLVGVLVIGNLVGVGRLVVEQRGEPFLERYRDGRFVACWGAAAWLDRETGRGVRVLSTTREGPALAWWSGRAVLGEVSGPAMRAGRLLVVRPLSAEMESVVLGLGWSISEALVVVPGGAGEAAWSLHEVVRPGGVEAVGGVLDP